jgi:3-deoxy-D-manno-octulosonic-acid transferase
VATALVAFGYRTVMGALALALGVVARAPGPRAWRRDLAERLGRYPRDLRARLGTRRTVWLHAASVGELQGLRALIGPLRERFVEHAIVVSTLTATGRALAATTAGVDVAIFFPWDAPRVVRRALETVRPDLFVFTETELWPRFLGECARRGIPCVLVSGRISARSVRRYALLRPLLRRALARVTCCMQSEEDAARIVRIGADPRRVQVAGNLKPEAPLEAAAETAVAVVLGRVGVPGRLFLIGASTHHGEEATLLRAFARVRGGHPDALLLLAPRHPERFADVAALLDAERVRWRRYSDLEGNGSGTEPAPAVVLLDSVGILRAFFPLATVVFVGGTLAPVGGHNLLEPAAHGCAIVIGPHVDHVATTARALRTAGGAAMVRDEAMLADVLAGLAADPEAAAAMGKRALAVAAAQRGALGRHLKVIAAVLSAASFARATRDEAERG